MKNIQEIQDRVRAKKFQRESVVAIHFMFMKEFGWISLDEFRELPIPTVLNLMNMIQESYKSQEREMSKAKGKGRFKR